MDVQLPMLLSTLELHFMLSACICVYHITQHAIG